MWVLASLLGGLLGDVFTDVRPYGLDYALSAMFIGLLLPHCRIPRRFAAALLSAALAVFFSLNGAAGWSAILATALSATIALALPRSGPEARRG
jgi:predicted branched-subunit amino acid permease